MHELSLAGAVVNTVEKHAAGRPVSAVYLRVGRLRQVVPETLEFYFGFVADGTACAGARLVQELVPALLRCRPCGREWEIDLPDFHCGVCGGADVEVVSGQELQVESIDVEEAPCTAPA